jgi:hypothetical protein
MTTRLFTFFILVFSSFVHYSYACDKSSASIVSATNNGNGTFTYVFNVCREYHGLEGNPDILQFAFNCSAAPIPAGQRVTVSTFSPASYSTSGGDVYTGSKSNGSVTYNNSSFSIVSAVSVLCSNFTITISGYATSVNVMTNDYPSAPCVITLPLAPLGLLQAPVASGKTICVNTATTLTAAGCSGGQLKWYSASSGGSSLQTGASYTPPTFAASKSYFVDCSVSTGGCATPRTEVAVTTVSPPAAPSTTSATICENSTALLGASGTHTLDWFSASSGGSSFNTGTSCTTPVLAAPQTYYVENSNGECHSTTRTPVTANVTPLPSTPSASASPSSICQGANTTFSASGCSGGTLEWYSASSGGSPVLTGSGFTTPALTSDETYYVGCNVSGCFSGRSAVSVSMLPCQLPLDLLSFTSSCLNNHVELVWEVANKIENAQFLVEKSNDGVYFYAENNNQNLVNQANRYLYKDNSEINGGTYYRVVLIDENGVRNESVSVRADINCKTKGVLIQNWEYQENEANIGVTASENDRIVLTIVDLSGKIIYSKTEDVFQGMNHFHLPLALASNIYLIKVSSSMGADVKKIVVN